MEYLFVFSIHFDVPWMSQKWSFFKTFYEAYMKLQY